MVSFHIEPTSKCTLECPLCDRTWFYHSKFLELCQKFKDNNCSLHVHTNGSAKTKAWWEKLNKILTKDDCITFAIDGLEDTNHLYRKNAKWNSVMTAIETLKDREFKMIWQFIPFKHNQHQIAQASKMSKELSFDEFKLIQNHLVKFKLPINLKKHFAKKNLIQLIAYTLIPRETSTRVVGWAHIDTDINRCSHQNKNYST